MTNHPKKVVLLDLDGTLTQSDPGIIACVIKAFEGMGLPVPDDDELHRFIGPAIIESLRRNHVPEDMLDRGVEIYRDYYANQAVFDDPNNPGQKVPGRLVNTVYPGIRNSWPQLRAKGYVLAIATLQARIPGRTDLRAFPCGPHGGRHLRRQQGQFAHRQGPGHPVLLRSDRFRRPGRDRAVMVGDRWTDIDGARACGVDTIGCRWGYAEPGEMEEHGAYAIIEHVDQLADAVERYFAR